MIQRRCFFATQTLVREVYIIGFSYLRELGKIYPEVLRVTLTYYWVGADFDLLFSMSSFVMAILSEVGGKVHRSIAG